MRVSYTKLLQSASVIALLGGGLLLVQHAYSPTRPEPVIPVVAPNASPPHKQSKSPAVATTAKRQQASQTAPPPLTATAPDHVPASTARPVSKLRRTPIKVGNIEYPNLPYQASGSTNDSVSDQAWEQSVGLPAARSLPAGSYAPIVAVIDSGVALQHEDLGNSWLTNSGESGAVSRQAASLRNCADQSKPLDKSCNRIDDNSDGIVDNEIGTTTLQNQSQFNCADQAKPLDKSCNNIDDDGNGKVDDYLGYDFINGDRSVLPGQTNPRGGGVSHGTLVTGVIAATNNNGRGIAGISPNARILPLQALDDDGSGYTASVAAAIFYAVERGADVINLSLGGDEPDAYLKQAIDYANKQGTLVVAAAGNDGCGCASYPAAYSAAIAVGAVDNSGTRASFSNWHDSVDITAPGVNLYTTAWTSTNASTAYRNASGTSLSTPVISGSVAALISRAPNASPLQTKALLYEHTSQANLTAGAARDPYYGYGTVSVLSSLQRSLASLGDEQIYSFYAIRSGRTSDMPWGRLEDSKTMTVYSCSGNRHAGLAVYELSKNGSSVYTASEVERDAAVAAGYSAQPQFNWCVLQDGDASLVRSMNIFAELKNSYPKE